MLATFGVGISSLSTRGGSGFTTLSPKARLNINEIDPSEYELATTAELQATITDI